MISRFKRIAAGKAAIFVTHQLENTRIADHIVGPGGGRVVKKEPGTS
ncbi:hypothetical protein ACIBL6_20445 [Streptomyces sp. NPDC050400]